MADNPNWFNQNFGSNDQLRRPTNQPSYFDIGFPIAGVAISANAGKLITSTAADYFGFSILTTSAGAQVRIYDATTGSGKLLDCIIIAANTSTKPTTLIPVRARLGIYVVSTLATGAEGTILYAPKG